MSLEDVHATPNRQHEVAIGPGGHTGNDSVACAAGSHPNTGSSAKPLPDPTAAYDPPETKSHPEAEADLTQPPKSLLTQRGLVRGGSGLVR